MRCGLRDCRRSCNSKNTSTAAAPRFCRSDGSREADDLTETVLIAIPRRCGACLCPDCGEAVDHVLRASRLPSLLQQQQQHQQQQRSAFVGATEVAKPVTSRQSYRPPSCDAAVPAFALIAEKQWIMRCGLRDFRRSYNSNNNINSSSAPLLWERRKSRSR